MPARPRRPNSTTQIIRRLELALRDIERDRKRPESELRKRAETVLAQLSGLPAAILIANNRGRYIDANRAATVLTGFPREELMRLSVWDLTPATRQSIGRRLWRDFLSRGRMSGVYPLRRKDGRLSRPRYVAVANVLPGVHVSALVTATLVRRVSKKPQASRGKR